MALFRNSPHLPYCSRGADHYRTFVASSWPACRRCRLDADICCSSGYTAALVSRLGFYAAHERPWDRRAWLLLMLLISHAVFVIGTDMVDSCDVMATVIRDLALVYRTFWVFSWPVWMMLFAISFPERAMADRRRPWMKWAILIPVSGFCVVYMLIRILRNEGKYAAWRLADIGTAMGWLMQDLFWFTVATSLGFWLAKPSRATGQDARRRLRVLFFGLAVSFFCPFFSLSSLEGKSLV